MRVPLFLAFLATMASADARIGETPVQFADRYGRPKDTAADKLPSAVSALVEGAIHHTYEYQGWKIRAAFLQLDGPAVRMDFSKIPNGQDIRIQEYELQAIASANTPAGTTWKQIAYKNANLPSDGLNRFSQALLGAMIGEKMWQRSDGAILWLRSHLIVRLELPTARQYEEQLQRTKEQKARASVPKF